MPHSVTLSSLALLAIGGAASGVYLGRSAVAEIDPAHYSSAWKEHRFYADMVPGGTGDGGAQMLPAVDFTGLGDGRIDGHPAEEAYLPQHDGSRDAFDTAYPGPPIVPMETLLAEVDRQIAQIGRTAAVDRYAAYPIEQRDQAPVVAVEVAPAVLVSEPEATAAPDPPPPEEPAAPIG